VPPAHAVADPAACRHCGTLTADEFCCRGCEIVFGLLHREKLERFYDLGGGRDAPAALAEKPAADHKWLELAAADLAARPDGRPHRVSLDIQGIHCAACVWLVERLFERTGAPGQVIVSSALGKIDLDVAPSFPLADFVTSVERFGYRLGPALRPAAARSSLLLRLGVCVALAMNGMIFSVALYAGLAEGPLHRLFLWITFGLSAASVAVGGTVFIASAARALARGVLHIDLPIALGILLAFGSSALTFAGTGGDAVYFDTLNVFIALMLVGRWLQERVVERNRRLLLESDGADGLLARRVSPEGVVSIVPCREIAAGDRLLVAAGDLVCVDAALDEERGLVSLDWVSGESAPREVARGERVPAGAFNLGPRALSAVAATDFAASPLPSLLRAPRPRAIDSARATPWWRRFAGVYVAGVLVAAAVGFLLWAHDPARALEVTTAVLILTCPCAFGIATPLAYELAQAGLRRLGLHVRSGGFLDRALAVKKVVFDKTGTLTTGVLRVVDDAPLRRLDPRARRALYNLVARSTHPRSLAVKRALDAIGELSSTTPRAPCGPVFASSGAKSAPPAAPDGAGRAPFRLCDASVDELPGRGLTMRLAGHRYSLGAGPLGELVFGIDGRAAARIDTDEELRADAAHELLALEERGHEVWILSGDTPERVAALAREAGVPASRALGGLTPEGKADWLARHDLGDTLFIGDGINDSLVVERATCSGTPAIDRPFLPARSDFFFVTAGLSPVRRALEIARRLARVTRRNLAIAIAYNTVTVGLAYAGLMSPLLCAVLMPASSLTVVAATVASLGGRSRAWRS
jgi:Cu2+-exporting ATPase